jgi:hypothetical protein
MIEKSYKCDVCGVEKKVANHWFIAEMTNVGIHFHTWEWAVRECQLDEERVRHLCGQACAHKMLDEFLGKRCGN